MFDMKMLLPLDIQYFASGGVDDFDIESFDKEFEESLASEQDYVQEQEQDYIQEQEQDHVQEEQQEEVLEQQQEELEEQEQPRKNSADEAFAQLRRERDEFARVAKWVSDLAAQSGMTVEQLMERYEQQRLQKEAESKGVPVEVLQKLQTLENENKTIRDQMNAERFNQQVNETLQKYNGSVENFEKTLQYAMENGLVEALKTGAITFEAAYKLAHMDTLIEEAKQQAVQENLLMQKKRQQEASVANGGVIPQPQNDLDEIVANDVKEILENGGF